MKTYYLTKYALSQSGRIDARKDAKPRLTDSKYVYFTGLPWGSYMLGRDVFTDEAEARAAVIKARDKKIISLEKQIAKLRKIGGDA